jgi:hypothetical protein
VLVGKESKPEDVKDIGDSTRHAKRILEFIFRKLVDYKKLVLFHNTIPSIALLPQPFDSLRY